MKYKIEKNTVQETLILPLYSRKLCTESVSYTHLDVYKRQMQDHEGLATLRTLGHNMAYFLKCKEVGSKLVPLPPEEPWEMTNFIR